MNKPNYKRPLTVGIFIVAGISIFIAGVFMIGQQEKPFSKKFRVEIIVDDVNGLQPGNNVWLSGVKVGTVKKISFYGASQVAITVSIEKLAQSHIWKDAKARISTDGFIGNKIVVIYGGTVQAGTVSNGDLLQSEKSISTDDMVATLQSNNKNLLDITNDFKKISRKIASGQGTIGGLLYDSSMIIDFRTTIKNLKLASLKTDASLANVKNFTSRLDTQPGLVNELISDTTIFKELQRTVAELRRAASDASTFTDNMQAASSKLKDKDNTLGVLLQDEETAKDLKEIINNLKTSSVKLDEDLEAVQHNFLFRGYFKKEEKKKTNQ